MAAVSTRAPILRRLATASQPSALRASRQQQRRWAQVHDVRFLATTQHHRSTLEKYRDKLDAKAREEGHADINALKSAYAEKIEALRRKDAAATEAPPTPPPSPTSQADHPPNTPPPNPTTPRTASSTPASTTGVKPLSAILDLPKARTLPVKELTAIWRLRHASSPSSLCAVVPAATWTRMAALAQSHPQFVLPVPHPEQGAEIHFCQWAPVDKETGTSTVLFTQLAEYKKNGEFAVPHTTVTHHLDLVAEKGVVLMQGRVVDAENGGGKVSVDDARWLVMCLQKFYGGWEGEGVEDEGRAKARRELLEWFATGDERFSVERLLEEAERM